MRKIFLTFVAALTVSPMALHAQKAADRLAAAADVITDMMRADDKGIPQDLLNKASCVVVVPNLKKAGFILGAKYGRGFAMCRRAGGAGWTAPASIRVEGGSFGLQIGGTEQDIVLLVMSESGMNHLLADKFTLGGDASAAAGPVGRAASAETDAQMHAEMLSYSRSRGLFGGLTLEGATLRPDADANKELYGHDVENKAILQGGVQTPPAAAKLEQLLDRNSSRQTR